jgi:hypothetical protein
LPATTDAAKQLSGFNVRSFDPGAEFVIDPVWNRDRPDVTAFAVQIYDRPMSLALMEVIDGQFGHLVTSEPTRKQEG